MVCRTRILSLRRKLLSVYRTKANHLVCDGRLDVDPGTGGLCADGRSRSESLDGYQRATRKAGAANC